MKKFKILIIALLFALIGSFVYAGAENSICVYKLVNRETKNFVLPEGGTKPTQEYLKEHELDPVAGSEIVLYKVEKYDKPYYDKLSLNELGTPLKRAFTDKDGSATFSSLEDGIYYIRDLDKDYVSNSVTVELPYKANGKLIRDLNIFLKSRLPEKPPIPPERPPHYPPGRPPHTPPDTPTIPTPPEPPFRAFIKIDKDHKKPLEGAVFKVVSKEKDGFVPVIKDGKEYVVTSGADGRFYVQGIGTGNFYLVETVAPTDENYRYKLLAEPFGFELDNLTNELDPVRIENAPEEEVKIEEPKPKTPASPGEKPPQTPDTPKTPGVKIPKTGDIQIILYIASGIAFFVMGLYMYIVEIKKRKLWN